MILLRPLSTTYSTPRTLYKENQVKYSSTQILALLVNLMKDYKTNSQKSLSSNQICTKLNCEWGFIALAQCMNLLKGLYV